MSSDYYTAMVMAASNYPTGNQINGSHLRGGVNSAAYCTQRNDTSCGAAASVNTSVSSVASSSTSAKQGGKRSYTHNPYASEPSTPTNGSTVAHSNSANSSFAAGSDNVGYQSGGSTYAPEGSYLESYPSMTSVTEQFYGLVGLIAHTARTARGRHLLTSILRLQHIDKIQIIFDEVAPQVNTVALDSQGCHVIRTMIEYLTPEQVSTLVAYFDEPTIIALATSSQHTRRVLQTLFERHKSHAFDYIVQVVAADGTRLAMTQQGCIAVMRMIEHSLPHQRQHLLAVLMPSLPSLTMDPYGNYVVQSILQNMDSGVSSAVVCNAFAGHWVPLSCNKFASNVMERVVRLMSGSARASLVRELVMDTANLLCLMQDGFGNFVLQAVIDSSADHHEFRAIADTIRPHLHTSPYGHKIEGKLKGKRFHSHGHRSSSSNSGFENSGYSSSSGN